MDNVLDRLELCHILATNLDSAQQKIGLGGSGDDAESGKDEVEEERKKPVFHIYLIIKQQSENKEQSK